MDGITLRPFAPSDAGWLTARHQTLYAEAEGFDDSFGPLVASIFCVATSQTRAKLRLFPLEPQARGTGLAQHMLATCLAFARAAGYRDLRLWTHESHTAAGRLYDKNGFVLIASAPVHSFGVDLVEQTWAITL